MNAGPTTPHGGTEDLGLSCPIPASTGHLDLRCWLHGPRLRTLLPSRAEPGRPVRRLVLRLRAVDPDLLPAQLSCPHATSRQSAIPADGGCGAPGRVPGVQALPPGRITGIARMGSRGDAVARAMRLIADGVVDREGVAGIATRLGYSERQVHRLLLAEVGAGPLALRPSPTRAQTARVLVETTDLRLADVAFAAGFASVRQFNDTVREVFATTPTELRPSRAPGRAVPRWGRDAAARGTPALRRRRARGVPRCSGDSRRRGSRRRYVPAYAVASERRRRPRAHAEARRCARHAPARCALGPHDRGAPGSPPVRSRRRSRDGLGFAGRRQGPRTDRPPRHPAGACPVTSTARRLAARAVLGQQVTVTGARTLAARLVERLGKPLDAPDDGLTHRFPDAGAIAAADLSDFGVPGAQRGRAPDHLWRDRRRLDHDRLRCRPRGAAGRAASRSPVSVRGRRNMCWCAESATPTRSSRPTSACARAQRPSDSSPTHTPSPRTPNDGGRGVRTP